MTRIKKTSSPEKDITPSKKKLHRAKDATPVHERKKKSYKNSAKKSPRRKKYNDPYARARDDRSLSFVDHLGEIRSRLLIIIIIMTVLIVIAFAFFSKELYNTITYPYIKTGNILHGFTLAAGFMARVKIAVVVALMFTMPLIIFHIWKFIRPAVAVHNRSFARNSIVASLLLFYSGIAFVFFFLLPMGLPILLEFFFENLKITIGIDSYISTLLTFCLGMGLVFQLPIVVMILTKIGILTPQVMIKYRRHSIVVIWIVAAIITPQDVWSQILVAIPLMFLYEVSIILSKIIVKRSNNKREK